MPERASQPHAVRGAGPVHRRRRDRTDGSLGTHRRAVHGARADEKLVRAVLVDAGSADRAARADRPAPRTVRRRVEVDDRPAGHGLAGVHRGDVSPRSSTRSQDSLSSLVEAGGLDFALLTPDDAPEMRELMQVYRDQPMDLADAALVAVAAREGLRRSSPSIAGTSRSIASSGGPASRFVRRNPSSLVLEARTVLSPPSAETLQCSDRSALLLEVIVQSEADARAAAEGGADRLEVVRAIRDGGLTPRPRWCGPSRGPRPCRSE